VTAMVARQNDASREALSRLPKLDIHDLREEWRRLYNANASPHLSRELLIPKWRRPTAIAGLCHSLRPTAIAGLCHSLLTIP